MGAEEERDARGRCLVDSHGEPRTSGRGAPAAGPGSDPSLRVRSPWTKLCPLQVLSKDAVFVFASSFSATFCTSGTTAGEDQPCRVPIRP